MITKTEYEGAAERQVKEIKRKTRREFSAEEKIRIVLDGLRGESAISELCRPLPGIACYHAREGRSDFGEFCFHAWDTSCIFAI